MTYSDAAAAGNHPPLSMLYAYLTEECNLFCRHCWIQPAAPGPQPAGRHLEFEDLLSAVEQALPLGLGAVKLTGGEPLLHPEFPSILKWLQQRELALTIETNGTLITPELAEAIAASPRTSVSVSLDGATSATHDWLRRAPGSHGAALAGIRALAAKGVRPEIIMTVLRRNRPELEQVVRLAGSLGAGSVKFNVLQPVARGKELFAAGETLPVGDLVSLARWVEEDLAARAGVPLFFHHPLAFRPLSQIFADRSPGCGQCGILGILGVLADGSYALCGIGRHVPELVFGSVANTPLRQVWQGHPLLSELRQGLPGRLKGVCADCLMKQMCLGGCLAYNYDSQGSFWGPFWYCHEARQAGMFPPSRLASA